MKVGLAGKRIRKIKYIIAKEDVKLLKHIRDVGNYGNQYNKHS